MKFILIPDSFKGTLSSSQICAVMDEKIKKHFPDSRTVSIPVADGGEGSVDAFITAVGGVKEYVTVKNPYFEDMESYFGLIDAGQTAVIEMASCAGLPLVEDRKDPRLTTTYGVGQLILAAAGKGVKKIIVGLGGSSTNDGGCGAAAAAGIRFYDRGGREFIPTGGTTADIDRIDLSGRDSLLEQVEIVTMCDIDNPMYGPLGAACIFGPQKGADEAMVKRLDAGLRHLSGVLARDLGRDVSGLPGAGAAGGMGGGAAAFLQAQLRSGIEVVLDTVRFDERIEGADVIFTGEGRLDCQSLMGKVVGGVAQRAKRKGIPLVAVAGSIDENTGDIYTSGVSAAFSITRKPVPFREARKSSEENLAFAMDNILRLLAISEGNKAGTKG